MCSWCSRGCSPGLRLRDLEWIFMSYTACNLLHAVQYSTSASEPSFWASLRNECPVGSGHSASPAAEQGLCCCLAVVTWAKQMVVSSYLCSYTPPVQKAPFFSWKRLANDYGGRYVTLMTLVALQPTVRQKLILKMQTMHLEAVRCSLGILWSDKRLQSVVTTNNKISWIQNIDTSKHPDTLTDLQVFMIFAWTLMMGKIKLV